MAEHDAALREAARALHDAFDAFSPDNERWQEEVDWERAASDAIDAYLAARGDARREALQEARNGVADMLPIHGGELMTTTELCLAMRSQATAIITALLNDENR